MTGAYIGAALLAIVGMVVASFAGPAGWTAVGVGALIVFGYLVLSFVLPTNIGALPIDHASIGHSNVAF